MERYNYIRFALSDIHGRSRGRIIPARNAQNCTEEGVPIYGGTLFLGPKDEIVSVPGANFDCERPPRISIVPDITTLHSVPWCGGDEFNVAEVICESYWVKDRTPQLACPRYVAKQQLDRLAHHGYKLLSGFEMEFLLTIEGDLSPSSYQLVSHRELAKKSPILFKIEDLMFQAGVDIENMHSEHDPGLFEMVLTPKEGISAADSAFKFKTGVQELADGSNFNIVFKSKVENSMIGMHFNHSLWSVSNNENVFADTFDNLSETGRHWLAGLIKHAKALTSLFSPTVNCYKRLHQSYKPSLVFWDSDDRSACIKVKSSTTKKGIYIENRMASGMSNPYLVLAATVAAGLDGIANKLECPPPGKTSEAELLPHSLPEALRGLMADRYLVECLGIEFVECFSATVTSATDTSM